MLALLSVAPRSHVTNTSPGSSLFWPWKAEVACLGMIVVFCLVSCGCLHGFCLFVHSFVCVVVLSFVWLVGCLFVCFEFVGCFVGLVGWVACFVLFACLVAWLVGVAWFCCFVCWLVSSLTYLFDCFFICFCLHSSSSFVLLLKSVQLVGD